MTPGRTTRTRRRPGRPVGGRLVADRTQLLEAAERAIEASGMEVTMEAIAAEASVTKPILYRSVGDRDALVIALSERFVQRVNVAAAHDVARATSPRDAVYLLVRAFLDTVEGQSNLFLFVTAGTVGRDRVARSLSLADLSAVPLADLLARLHSAGEPPDQLASLIWAHGMIGAMQYATLWWLRNRSCTTHELAEHLTQLIWSGIAPPGQ